MIKRKGNVYKIDTPNTTLLIGTEEKCAQYLYYGKKLSTFDGDYEIFCGKGRKGEVERKLVSSFGEADPLGCGIVCAFSDGSFTTRFTFTRAKLVEKPDLYPLPSSYAAEDKKGEGKTLCLEFTDEPSKVKLYLYYTAFEDSDVISVSSRLYNGGKKTVYVKSLPSLQLDLYGDDYSLVTFRGEWLNEQNKRVTPVNGARVINESRMGSSSHEANPFVMLKKEGSVYAFNLVYSGNHKESAEADFLPRTRVLIGLNNFMFEKKLGTGEELYSPEAVMCYGKTEDEISVAMHSFVNRHIVRGKWKDRERPIVINNWEATAFSFTREKILAFAEAAENLGIEALVLDDGWFGKRDMDDCSLGDWTDYKEKTGGIASLAEAVRERGLKFGIWVEPEMISENSELYKKHPEYAMKIPGRTPLKIRNQLMLNLADVNVQKYVVRAISGVISETKAAFVKWDYNRCMTDCFSKEIASGEYFLEYMKGVYTVLRKLTERFPSVLFEGCASGGGRFDLGTLCFMPQIWASDNTDARQRTRIQGGASYGYPQSAISCHVSASPNRQTGNASALETRANVAFGGVFGYEMDITTLSDEEKQTVKEQICFYKKYRKVLQYGTFYRLGDVFSDKTSGFICVNENKTLAVAVVYTDASNWGYTNRKISLKGLDGHTRYELSYRPQDNYGEEKRMLVNGEMLMNGEISLNGILQETSPQRSANGLYARAMVIKKISQRAKK